MKIFIKLSYEYIKHLLPQVMNSLEPLCLVSSSLESSSESSLEIDVLVFPFETIEHICRFIDDPKTFLNFSLASWDFHLATKRFTESKQDEFQLTHKKTDGYGMTRITQTLPDGRQHGSNTRWYEYPNKVAYSCSWKNGRKQGIEKRFFDNTQMEHHIEWKNNHKIDETEWYANGQRKTVIKYKNTRIPELENIIVGCKDQHLVVQINHLNEQNVLEKHIWSTTGRLMFHEKYE